MTFLAWLANQIRSAPWWLPTAIVVAFMALVLSRSRRR